MSDLHTITGRGLYDIAHKVASAILKPDESINKLYAKEQHGILKLPSGKYAYSNYMGPGTRLDIRVPRGDKGLTPIDIESEAHDLRYVLLHKDGKDIDDKKRLAREADVKFNQVIDKLRKEGKEPEINLKQAELIKLKVFLEKNKFLHDLSYKMTGPEGDRKDTPELTALYRKELQKLEQQGYGSMYKTKIRKTFI